MGNSIERELRLNEITGEGLSDDVHALYDMINRKLRFTKLSYGDKGQMTIRHYLFKSDVYIHSVRSSSDRMYYYYNKEQFRGITELGFNNDELNTVFNMVIDKRFGFRVNKIESSAWDSDFFRSGMSGDFG